MNLEIRTERRKDVIDNPGKTRWYGGISEDKDARQAQGLWVSCHLAFLTHNPKATATK
jgi:hypothetical protein